MEGQHQEMDRSVTVVVLRIAHDNSLWADITAEASIGVPQRRPSITGISYLWHILQYLVFGLEVRLGLHQSLDSDWIVHIYYDHHKNGLLLMIKCVDVGSVTDKYAHHLVRAAQSS